MVLLKIMKIKQFTLLIIYHIKFYGNKFNGEYLQKFMTKT